MSKYDKKYKKLNFNQITLIFTTIKKLKNFK